MTQLADYTDTECDKRLTIQNAYNNGQARTPLPNAKARIHHHDRIWMDQQETRQALLFYDIMTLSKVKCLHHHTERCCY